MILNTTVLSSYLESDTNIPNVRDLERKNPGAVGDAAKKVGSGAIVGAAALKSANDSNDYIGKARGAVSGAYEKVLILIQLLAMWYSAGCFS